MWSMSTKKLKRKKKIKIEIRKLRHKTQKLVDYFNIYGTNQGKSTDHHMANLERVINRIKELRGVSDPKAEEYVDLYIVKTIDDL